jgi:hypothetical protein
MDLTPLPIAAALAAGAAVIGRYAVEHARVIRSRRRARRRGGFVL